MHQQVSYTLIAEQRGNALVSSMCSLATAKGSVFHGSRKVGTALSAFSCIDS